MQQDEALWENMEAGEARASMTAAWDALVQEMQPEEHGASE